MVRVLGPPSPAIAPAARDPEAGTGEGLAMATRRSKLVRVYVCTVLPHKTRRRAISACSETP